MRAQSVTLIVPAKTSDLTFETSLRTIEMDLRLLPGTVSAQLSISSRKGDVRLPTVALDWNSSAQCLELNAKESNVAVVPDSGQSHFIGRCVLLKEGESLNSGVILRACVKSLEATNDSCDLSLRIMIV